jgi:hypothetical protein
MNTGEITMDNAYYEMSERLGIKGAVRRAVESGQDQRLIQDVVFGLFCQLLGDAKVAMARTTLDQDMPTASKLMALAAIDNDVNYLWD